MPVPTLAFGQYFGYLIGTRIHIQGLARRQFAFMPGVHKTGSGDA